MCVLTSKPKYQPYSSYSEIVWIICRSRHPFRLLSCCCYFCCFLNKRTFLFFVQENEAHVCMNQQHLLCHWIKFSAELMSVNDSSFQNPRHWIKSHLGGKKKGVSSYPFMSVRMSSHVVTENNRPTECGPSCQNVIKFVSALEQTLLGSICKTLEKYGE